MILAGLAVDRRADGQFQEYIFHRDAMEHEFHGDINTKKYCNKISKLVSEFGERFVDFKNLEYDFSIFCNPFSVSADEVSEQFQLKLTELQCNSLLKDKFSTIDIGTFYQYVGPTYPTCQCSVVLVSVNNSFL